MFINTSGIALGEHTLILESFDSNSKGVESTLKTDSVTIIITEEEGVNQEILDTFSETPIKISVTAGALGQNYYLSDLVQGLETALGVTDLLDEPSTDISLQTEYDFLAQDSLTISVSPPVDLEAAVYEDASLVVQIYGQKVTIPIEVTVTACSLDVKFEPAKITEEYVIGSGSKSVQFPSLT